MKSIDGDFVQFFSLRRSYHKDNELYYSLYNGFSYVWDEANPRWIKDIRNFIPKKENVYVSVWFPHHHMGVLEWAAEFPEVTFTVGGPMYFLNVIRCQPKYWNIPKNVFIIPGLVESIFDKPINLKDWKIHFPRKDKLIQYSYYVGLNCYWNKCTFCVRPKWEFDNDSNRTNIGYDLEPLWNAPAGVVYFTASSFNPPMLRNILPKLNYTDKKYWMMMRAGQGEYEALRDLSENKNVDLSKIIFDIGVEFPSNRMFKIMNKGLTVSNYVNVINFLKDKATLNILYMTAWPNLTKQDIEEAKIFVKKIYDGSESSKDILNIRGELYNNISSKKLRPGFEGTFIRPLKPKLTPEEQELDNEWVSILDSLNTCTRRGPKSRFGAN